MDPILLVGLESGTHISVAIIAIIYPHISKMKGLQVIKEAISQEEEEKLISSIDKNEWDNRYKRRTQYYGYDYHYRTRGLTKLDTIPTEFIPSSVASHISPDAIIINEYYDGQGITPHTDAMCWGNRIVILSLGADTTMKFSADLLSIDVTLPRRSLLILEDKPRYKLKHSIDHKGDRRVSLTYRTIAPGVTTSNH